MKEKIWCIEDDDNIREIILYTLSSCGYEARGFTCASHFLQAARESRPDLILLDIMLPETDGEEILHMIRHGHLDQVPVIMTTARSQERDVIRFLENGADDYLIKPFSMMEMAARIKAVLRRAPQKGQKITLHGITMDEMSHQVFTDDQPVSLTYKEYELLRLLISHPGQVFSRDELLNKIWGIHWTSDSRTLDTHIKSLRTKLGDKKDHIQTVRGVGYRMEP